MTDIIKRGRELLAKATHGWWYLLGAPWLPSDCNTMILARSPDPHAGTTVCDFPFAGEDGDTEDNSWNDAELIAFAKNNLPALLDVAEAAKKVEEVGCGQYDYEESVVNAWKELEKTLADLEKKP